MSGYKSGLASRGRSRCLAVSLYCLRERRLFLLFTLCCRVFQKFNADFDLSAREGADSLAFISLMEEKLTPALVRNQESLCGPVTDDQSDDSALTACVFHRSTPSGWSQRTTWT